MIDKYLIQSIANKKKYFFTLFIRTLPITLLTISHALLMAYLIDQAFLKHHTLSDLFLPLTLLCLIFTLKPLYQYHFEKNGRLMASYSKKFWRDQMARHVDTQYQHLEDENIAGYFMTLAGDGVESTDAYYSEFIPQLMVVGVNTIFLLGLSFYLDWVSGLIMLVTAPLIPLFMILIGKTAQGISLVQWDELKRMNGHLLDLLRGILTLRSYQLDQQQSKSVRKTSESFKSKTLSVLKVSFLSAFTLELTATLSTALIAVSLGVRLLYGQILFLPALSVLLIAPEYFMPLRQLGLKYHAAMNAKAFSQQLKAIIPNVQSISSNDISNNTLPLHFETLKIQNLNFEYNQEKIVFRNLNQVVSLKSPVALTGVSGSGKSTLLKLLSGDLKSHQGEIYLDHLALSSLSPDENHQLVAFVPQKPVIFEMSLLDNLTFGNPTLELEAVLEACETCHFNAVLERLPQGLQTLIGEGFQSLSGGEAQLLSLTRAYLRHTPILLLDEPSSALDPVSECHLANALKTISAYRSLIIAAHRKGSIQLCQETIHLERRTSLV